MAAFLIQLCNMSMTGSYVIIAVLLLRQLLRRAPKKYSYALWLAVGFRLGCPFSWPTGFSLFNVWPWQIKTLTTAGGTMLRYIPTALPIVANARISTGITTADTWINQIIPTNFRINNYWFYQILLDAAWLIWAVGLVILAIAGIVAHVQLQRRIAVAVRLQDRVYESENIPAPFILGIFQPRIYLPCGLREVEKTYVLLHETSHLQRRDYLVKPLAGLLLLLHWYNPLVWLAYRLMTQDMEASCDERVLAITGKDSAKDYSSTLLSLATARRWPAGPPLAFGETGLQKRIRNILHYRPASRGLRWFASLALVVILAVLTANPVYARPADMAGLYGAYRTARIVYTDPLAEFAADFLQPGNVTVSLTEDMLTINAGAFGAFSMLTDYRKIRLTDEAFRRSFDIAYGMPDISSYRERWQYQINDATEDFPGFQIYRMDDQIWLVELMSGQHGNEQRGKVLIIFQLERQ